MKVVDVVADESLLPDFYSLLNEIANSKEPLAENYKRLNLDEFLCLPVCVDDDGQIAAFSGLQYLVDRWDTNIARASSRFWLAPKYRRRGVAHFNAHDPNWTWHNAEYLIPYQIAFAKRIWLKQVFISRDRKDTRSFPAFIELVNAFAPCKFEMSPNLHDVCCLKNITPSSCVQQVAFANLEEPGLPFQLPICTAPQ
jgi:GNAT superfamily N-acetyltransferase